MELVINTIILLLYVLYSIFPIELYIMLDYVCLTIDYVFF
jgi:hypothetical protein